MQFNLSIESLTLFARIEYAAFNTQKVYCYASTSFSSNYLFYCKFGCERQKGFCFSKIPCSTGFQSRFRFLQKNYIKIYQTTWLYSSVVALLVQTLMPAVRFSSFHSNAEFHFTIMSNTCKKYINKSIFPKMGNDCARK